jgi:hypothetical protein
MAGIVLLGVGECHPSTITSYAAFQLQGPWFRNGIALGASLGKHLIVACEVRHWVFFHGVVV